MKDQITITKLTRRPRTYDEYIMAAHEMERIGGSFAASIAKAYFAADSHNKERLKAAFPDLFTQYFPRSWE